MRQKVLTVLQFSEATGYCPQSIYNMIYREMFLLGVHYYKPSSRKILFREDAVDAFLSGAIRRDYEERLKTDREKTSQKKAAVDSSQNLLADSKPRLPFVKINALKARLAMAELEP